MDESTLWNLLCFLSELERRGTGQGKTQPAERFNMITPSTLREMQRRSRANDATAKLGLMLFLSTAASSHTVGMQIPCQISGLEHTEVLWEGRRRPTCVRRLDFRFHPSKVPLKYNAELAQHCDYFPYPDAPLKDLSAAECMKLVALHIKDPQYRLQLTPYAHAKVPGWFCWAGCWCDCQGCGELDGLDADAVRKRTLAADEKLRNQPESLKNSDMTRCCRAVGLKHISRARTAGRLVNEYPCLAQKNRLMSWFNGLTDQTWLCHGCMACKCSATGERYEDMQIADSQNMILATNHKTASSATQQAWVEKEGLWKHERKNALAWFRLVQPKVAYGSDCGYLKQEQSLVYSHIKIHREPMTMKPEQFPLLELNGELPDEVTEEQIVAHDKKVINAPPADERDKYKRVERKPKGTWDELRAGHRQAAEIRRMNAAQKPASKQDGGVVLRERADLRGGAGSSSQAGSRAPHWRPHDRERAGDMERASASSTTWTGSSWGGKRWQ
jgi:hypothetical protein